MKRKHLLIILFILIVIIGIVVGVTVLNKEEPKEEVEVKVEDKIDSYGYTLDDNETVYYKSVFEELKTTLQEETLNEEAYASIIGKLFVTDFFNLDNKLSNSDIGGIQFVYNNYRETFLKFAKEGIYHHVENNLYGDRTQKLPKVASVTVDSVQLSAINYLDTQDPNGYIVSLTITYEADLGYQTKAVLYIVHNENKLEIVKMTK